MPHGPLVDSPGVLTAWELASPKNEQSKKESKTEAAVHAFYDLVSKVAKYHFCFILFFRHESLRPTRLKARGTGCHLLKKDKEETLWTCFKTISGEQERPYLDEHQKGKKLKMSYLKRIS